MTIIKNENDVITIPMEGDILLEHETMLLKCWTNKDDQALIVLSGSVVDSEYDFEITDLRPTKKILIEKH